VRYCAFAFHMDLLFRWSAQLGLVCHRVVIESYIITPNYVLLDISVQDLSLRCPSNVIWPFKIYVSQNNPSKRNPKLKMKMSLEILNIICMSQEPTSVGHCHYKK
jgi:hypothetical protein